MAIPRKTIPSLIAVVLISTTGITWAATQLWNASLTYRLNNTASDQDMSLHSSHTAELQSEHFDHNRLLFASPEIVSQHGQIIAATRDRKELDEASKLFKAAISARPTWPYDWANLAIVELRQPGMGNTATLSHALAQSLIFGYSERNLLKSVAREGIRQWNELPLDIQDQVVQAIERIYRFAPREARPLVWGRSDLPYLCESLIHADLKRVCRET